jgi:hypothetical protein
MNGIHSHSSKRVLTGGKSILKDPSLFWPWQPNRQRQRCLKLNYNPVKLFLYNLNGLSNKSSRLAPALGVSKFIIDNSNNLVKLFFVVLT